MSPDTELCQEREDQPLSELNIDQLCREIKFAFKVRKGVLEYYIKMFKFWLVGGPQVAFGFFRCPWPPRATLPKVTLSWAARMP